MFVKRCNHGISFADGYRKYYTKATVVDLEEVELKARVETLTTVNEDINIGVNKVLKELKAMGIDPDKAEYKLACSSAAVD